MSIEEDRDETFDRLPHLSMTEILRTRNKKNLQYDKSTYEKSRPNIIQHERLKAFFSKLSNKTSMSAVITAVQHCTGRVSRQERKSIQIAKEKVKLFLFKDNMILNIEKLKESTRKYLQLLTTK